MPLLNYHARCKFGEDVTPHIGRPTSQWSWLKNRCFFRSAAGRLWPSLCEKSHGCYDSLIGGWERRMSGFVEGIDRSQSTFFPPHTSDDYVAEDNPVRAVDAFVEGLDLGKLGFGRVVPLEQGRPGYRPATLLKIYIYGSSIGFRRAAGLSVSASAISSCSGSRDSWRRTSRPLRISARTTARRFVRSVVPSWHCAVRVISHLVVEIEPTKPTVHKVKFEPAGTGAPQTSNIDDWRERGRSPPDCGARLRRARKHCPRSASASGQPLHSPTCPPS